MQAETLLENSPRRGRRKEARPGELVAAALELFVEKGFAATRSEEVAARAGVSKGTLFLYFPTKEDLFKAVVQENIASVIQSGQQDLQNFTGTTAEMVPYLMEQWWERYGATKASGITKLMMSEASNFPELAQFYQQRVVMPGHAMISGVLERGIRTGEFRQVDVGNAVYAILSPMMYLIMWKHSFGPCCPAGSDIDPIAYLRSQADIVVQGLLRRDTGFTSTTSTRDSIQSSTHSPGA